MPSSTADARAMVAILLEHMPPEQAAEISDQLWERIGKHTEDLSVRLVTEMLRDRFEEIRRPPPIPRSGILLLCTVVFLHGIVIAANIVSGCVLSFWGFCGWPAPAWAVAFPVVTFVVWSSFSRNYDCPATALEDNIRRRYSRPPIKAFLKHYVLDPLRRIRS